MGGYVDASSALKGLGQTVPGLNELELVEDFADQGPMLFGNLYRTDILTGNKPHQGQSSLCVPPCLLLFCSGRSKCGMITSRQIHTAQTWTEWLKRASSSSDLG